MAEKKQTCDEVEGSNGTKIEITTKDPDIWIAELYKCRCLDEQSVQQLCKMVRSILMEEKNVHTISCPVTICGNIHGQFHDLMEVFKIGGFPPFTNYLFLGDFIRVGLFSVQTVSLLFALKVRYHKRITLIRGHHESAQHTKNFGFYDDIQKKYKNVRAWKYFVDTFDYLPLSALISKQIFCVHGGLSPQIHTLQHIEQLDRIQQIPDKGPMCDLLWSDPDDRTGWGTSPRGVGCTFGEDISKQWNHNNGLVLIARGHQLATKGYHWQHDKQCLTLMSDSDFRGRTGNQGAIMEMDEHFGFVFHQYLVSPKKVKRRVMLAQPDYFL